MQLPKYITITSETLHKQNWLYHEVTPGSIHPLMDLSSLAEVMGYAHTKEYVYVMSHGRPCKVFSDEFEEYTGPVNAEILENSKRFFEKSQPESKTSTIFVSSVNSLKNKNMKKETKTVAQVSNLTKTEMSVMEAIFSNPKKGKAVKSDNEEMVGVVADLAVVDGELPGVDAAKVCRKLHRAGLITYTWLEDKSREVAVTDAGFEVIQLGVKQPKPKADKKGAKAKATPTAEEVEDMTEAEVDEAMGAVPEGFEVKGNPVAKVFNITFPDGEKYRLKVKTAQEFKDCKDNTYEEWETLRGLDELTLVD